MIWSSTAEHLPYWKSFENRSCMRVLTIVIDLQASRGRNSHIGPYFFDLPSKEERIPPVSVQKWMTLDSPSVLKECLLASLWFLLVVPLFRDNGMWVSPKCPSVWLTWNGLRWNPTLVNWNSKQLFCFVSRVFVLDLLQLIDQRWLETAVLCTVDSLVDIGESLPENLSHLPQISIHEEAESVI